MSADLRARIAQALCLAFEHAASSVSTGSETITYGNMADVAAAEVQAELDAKDARIADTKRLLDNRVQDCVDLTQRAERAEADLARSKDVAIREAEQVRSERNRYAERAEQAEALADEHAANAGELGERLRQAEAERDRLRAADGRVRALHKPASYPSPDGPGEITYCVGCEESDSSHPCLTIAALDQAPVADSPYATGGEILPRTQGDQIPAQLSGCDFAINPEPAAEQDGGGR